jgi:surface protein
VSDWDTSAVTNASSMFYECSALTTPPDVSDWDASQVTDMSYMFYGCTSLASPDVSRWPIGRTCDTTRMFG